MNTGIETITHLDRFLIPWGKEIDLKIVKYESRLKMLRITIREKNRFTVIDLDTEAASKLADYLTTWAKHARREIDLLK